MLFRSMIRHTRFSSVTGVQTCALPIYTILFLDVAHPTVVGIVNRLEKKGYLNCHLDENNKRNKMVCSTCEAEKLLNKMYEGRRAAEQRLLHSFSENEVAQAKKLLEKLYENIR